MPTASPLQNTSPSPLRSSNRPSVPHSGEPPDSGKDVSLTAGPLGQVVFATPLRAQTLKITCVINPPSVLPPLFS